METFINLLSQFVMVIWQATDPFGVAFAIIGTYGFRALDDSVVDGDPPDKKDRTLIRRLLPVIPVFLGFAWVVMYEMVFTNHLFSELILQRAVGTGCSALAVHKIWWHTIKNT